MQDKPAPSLDMGAAQVSFQSGVIPRMGMTVAMPASTKPPAVNGDQCSMAQQEPPS